MMGYIYDAEGHRVAKGTITSLSCDVTSNGFAQTASYIVGAKGEQVSELNSTGGFVHTNVFANGALLATYTASDTQFALTDWLGTKRIVVGASGCGTSFTQYPYGDGLTTQNLTVDRSTLPQCADATEHQFTGRTRTPGSSIKMY